MDDCGLEVVDLRWGGIFFDTSLVVVTQFPPIMAAETSLHFAAGQHEGRKCCKYRSWWKAGQRTAWRGRGKVG